MVRWQDRSPVGIVSFVVTVPFIERRLLGTSARTSFHFCIINRNHDRKRNVMSFLMLTSLSHAARTPGFSYPRKDSSGQPNIPQTFITIASTFFALGAILGPLVRQVAQTAFSHVARAADSSGHVALPFATMALRLAPTLNPWYEIRISLLLLLLLFVIMISLASSHCSNHWLMG